MTTNTEKIQKLINELEEKEQEHTELEQEIASLSVEMDTYSSKINEILNSKTELETKAKQIEDELKVLKLIVDKLTTLGLIQVRTEREIVEIEED